MLQEDVLRLQVAVNNVHLRQTQERERLEDLLGEFANEVQGDPVEGGVAEEVVEVDRELLEHEALVSVVLECVVEDSGVRAWIETNWITNKKKALSLFLKILEFQKCKKNKSHRDLR